jgi:hypothetical protein
MAVCSRYELHTQMEIKELIKEIEKPIESENLIRECIGPEDSIAREIKVYQNEKDITAQVQYILLIKVKCAMCGRTYEINTTNNKFCEECNKNGK